MTVMLDLEAKAFQEAFCEYYGADVLDYSTAIACADEIRYEGGLDLASEMMEASVREPLARAMENGSADKARVVMRCDGDVSVASSELRIIAATRTLFLAVMFGLLLAAGVLSGCASAQNVLEVGRISVSYPDALEPAQDHADVSEADDGTTTTGNTLLGEDGIIFIVQDIQSEKGYGEARRIAQDARQFRLDMAGELEGKWGTPRSLAESTYYDAPEDIIVDGQDAFVLRSRFYPSDGVTEYGLVYCVDLGDGGVGLVVTSYTDEQYERSGDVIDRVMDSIKVR